MGTGLKNMRFLLKNDFLIKNIVLPTLSAMKFICCLTVALIACYLAADYLPSENTHVLQCGNSKYELNLFGRFFIAPILKSCTITVTTVPRNDVRAVSKYLLNEILMIIFNGLYLVSRTMITNVVHKFVKGLKTFNKNLYTSSFAQKIVAVGIMFILMNR